MTPPSPSTPATARSLDRDEAHGEPRRDDGGTGRAAPSLAERLADSDRSALEAVFRRLSEPVFRYVAGMVDDEAEARDITQDTFLRLWSAREELAEVESLPAYVFRVARNRVYNRQRDRRTREKRSSELESAVPPSRPDAPDEELEARQLRALVDSWLDELPERQREAVVLSRREELSHEEIGDVMGISPHTVNNHIVNGLEKLRRRARRDRPDLLS